MSKFDEKLTLYKGQMDKLGIKYDSELFEKVTKGLGPSIYNADSESVSCSQKSELETVKNNFLIKKLGCKDGPELDKAISKVCEKMGSSNRNKYRAVFYYLLVKEMNKESVYK